MAEVVLVVLAGIRGIEACFAATDSVRQVLPSAVFKVLHVRIDPMSTIMPTEEVMTDERRNELDHQGAEESQAVRAAFDAWQARQTDGRTIKWREILGSEEQGVSRFGDGVALIVIGQAPTADPQQAGAALYAALFEARRPVLMVPRGLSGAFGRKVIVGWKDSDTTRRAIEAAGPWLKQADSVEVIAVCEAGAGKLDKAKEAFDRLGVSAKITEVPAIDRPVGLRLLDEVAGRGGDLLVMGAYRHNRLVELVLGGATTDVLEHAQIPVLLLH